MRPVLGSAPLAEDPQVPSAVLSCALDPSDQRRLAFHLANGWSGDQAFSLDNTDGAPWSPGNCDILL